MDIYFQLFEDSYTPSKARLIYIAELKAKMGEEAFFKESSKRSINPSSTTVFNLWTRYSKRFGSAPTPSIKKIKRNVTAPEFWCQGKGFMIESQHY